MPPTEPPPLRFEQALAELEKLSGIQYDGMLVRVLARELKSEKAVFGE